MSIELFISIVSTIIAIIAFWVPYRNSKQCIRKRIEKKEHQLNKLNNQLFIQDRDNKYRFSRTTPLHLKIKKLESEIEELRKDL